MLATKLETLHNLIYETLGSCKNKYIQYISKRLCSKVITPKYYGSLLKTVLNDKKNSCIMFIIYDDKFFTGFYFLQISFFAKLCSIIENDIVFPSSASLISYLSVPVKLWIHERCYWKHHSKSDPNKAHDNDMISIRMLKNIHWWVLFHNIRKLLEMWNISG